MFGGIVDSFNGIYENVISDYITDVYTDVIEGYTIATLKVNIKLPLLLLFYSTSTVVRMVLCRFGDGGVRSAAGRRNKPSTTWT